ncbi:MAG: alkaline phosphatase D family protein [Bacteroidota bacterium]
MKFVVKILVFVPTVLFGQQADQSTKQVVQRIAFGSCSKQDKVESQLWKEVNNVSPDLWVWLGDNIYGDTEDMAEMRAKYDQQKSHPEYQLLASRSKVIGIWDDHDFGINDGGKEYPKKRESKLEMFRFLGVPEDHPARGREGAYQSYEFVGNKRIKVILLDARYFRDPLKKSADGINMPDPEGKILGDEQWRWLESQLADNSDLFIVGSGIQVIPEAHRYEKWANFPRERKRLLNLLSSVSAPLLIISGDRHMSEVSKIDHKKKVLYEFTSSSLTNPWSEPREEPNQYREKSIIYPTNFAVLDITWSKSSVPRVDLSYQGKGNEVYQRHSVEFQ